jgi:hypothetical protein
VCENLRTGVILISQLSISIFIREQERREKRGAKISPLRKSYYICIRMSFTTCLWSFSQGRRRKHTGTGLYLHTYAADGGYVRKKSPAVVRQIALTWQGKYRQARSKISSREHIIL